MAHNKFSIREQVGALVGGDKFQLCEGGAMMVVFYNEEVNGQDRKITAMFIDNGERHEMVLRKSKKIVLWLDREKDAAALDLELKASDNNDNPNGAQWELPLLNHFADQLANA